MNSLEIIITDDGSTTLFLKELNESYHSKFGAVNESRHVFIDSGFKRLQPIEAMNILEIGFGTGLNALLTILECTRQKIRTNYHALEPFPLSNSIYQELNYPLLINDKNGKRLFFSIHEADWDSCVRINEYFKLRKQLIKLQQAILMDDYYNLIYYDAFSPEVQPELWTTDCFEKIYKAMVHNGILVTYSAKGSVRRNLQAVGFKVERLAGPKGKREMIRSIKL